MRVGDTKTADWNLTVARKRLAKHQTAKAIGSAGGDGGWREQEHRRRWYRHVDADPGKRSLTEVGASADCDEE